LVQLLFFHVLFDVFHVPSFRPGDSTAGKPSGNPFRRLNAGGPLLVPTGGKEVTRTKERERRREMETKRTQETFGATAPGRRVLYSASWVLAASPPSGDAAVL
ncbi:MAG: hypothetical protein ACRDGP_03495, partial [Actinomycetota bacterium]